MAIRVGTGAWAKGNAAAERCRDWVERQDPATRRGATIGIYRRYRESDGGLLGVLLTAYFFVTAIPAAVVMMSYVYDDPTVLADRLANRLHLTGSVDSMLHSVLAGAAGHQLGATLIAVGSPSIRGRGATRGLTSITAISCQNSLTPSPGRGTLPHRREYESI